MINYDITEFSTEEMENACVVNLGKMIEKMGHWDYKQASKYLNFLDRLEDVVKYTAMDRIDWLKRRVNGILEEGQMIRSWGG